MALVRFLFLVLLLVPQAWASEAWEGWRITAQESRTERWMGREALVLKNGSAWLDTARFTDGIVEFDVAVSAEQGFHGFAFRAENDRDFEHFYLRPHQSGNPDATQYTPVYGGVSGWQIYTSPRFALPVKIAAERWVHVRAIIRGRRLEVEVDGTTLVFPEMVRPPVEGTFGLTAGGTEGRYANVVIRPGATAPPSPDAGAEAPATPSGTVMRWRVSTPFAESRLDSLGSLDPSEWSELEWDNLDSGVAGVANLAMLRARTPEQNTVFAAVSLRARRAGPLLVKLGFSDRVRVYLNGRPIYRGDDKYRSRDYRFLGSIGLFDELILPLQRGDNQLWLAVSEDFGGWGVVAQIPEGGGVEVGP